MISSATPMSEETKRSTDDGKDTFCVVATPLSFIREGHAQEALLQLAGISLSLVLPGSMRRFSIHKKIDSISILIPCTVLVS